MFPRRKQICYRHFTTKPCHHDSKGEWQLKAGVIERNSDWEELRFKRILLSKNLAWAEKRSLLDRVITKTRFLRFPFDSPKDATCVLSLTIYM